MNKIETRPLSEKSTAEELFSAWKVEFPEAKDLFSHFESNADKNPKMWGVSIGSSQCEIATVESLISGKIEGNNLVISPKECETTKIQSLISKEIGGNRPVISLKKWDSNDPHLPSIKCLFTLSTYPSKEMCNENNNPIFRYQLDNGSSEIMPIDLRSDVSYPISEDYAKWLEENFIVDFDFPEKIA